ncbi:MAG: hypothetical protein H6609_07650 [Ignavibacteriales bacterium]|nr:hypothetical protein [Ignavibacteriales bacterium]
MYDLMAEQSHSLLETTLSASNNALLSYETIDSELKVRLLNNANLVKLLYERNLLTDKLLNRIAVENNIYRINIFSIEGEKLFSSNEEIHTDLEENYSPSDYLYPIFNDEVDTLIIGLKKSRYQDEFRFAVAVASTNRSAIVVNINAEDLLKFRRQIGFGSLLKKLTNNDKIEFAALQDYNNILAASGNVENLEAIEESEFLLNSLNDSTFAWRILDSDTLQIFEAVHPFSHNGRLVGLFRLGLSLDPLNAINERIIRRLIIIGIILFVLGSLLLTYIFTQQNFDVLQKRFKIVEAYSDKVLHNVSDAVIVIDENNVIKISNNAANKLLNLNANSLDNKIETLNLDHSCFRIFNTNLGLEQIECNIQNDRKYLLISKSTFETENKSTNTVLVIRDLTEQKLLENQIQRKERMVAMGELASGVAHEIRNPLNTISTITQQLNKDFEPIENKEEFKTLSNLVANEVKRINQTVQSFLRFTKPEKISPSEFLLSELITQIENQYKLMLKEKSITFSHKLNWDGIVKWDRNQIQQVIMNLVQNSFDSIENKGEIYIESFKQNEDIIIKIKDNGPGIPSHILNKIFNLYFTTKAKGTGIGLSIVQKIIMEHGGIINVESEENNGTEFSIKLPIIYNS